MKAWTLFLVILFSNIYEQHHPSACSFIDNGSLHCRAKSIVKDIHGVIRTASETSIESLFFTLHVKNILADKATFDLIKNNQKLIIITIQPETETSVKQTNENTSLGNNSELDPNLKRKSLEDVYILFAKINFRLTSPEKTIETTLIKANFI
jgi:hypothetical protein